jgi:hypothetical protein
VSDRRRSSHELVADSEGGFVAAKADASRVSLFPPPEELEAFIAIDPEFGQIFKTSFLEEQVHRRTQERELHTHGLILERDQFTLTSDTYRAESARLDKALERDDVFRTRALFAAVGMFVAMLVGGTVLTVMGHPLPATGLFAGDVVLGIVTLVVRTRLSQVRPAATSTAVARPEAS